MNALKKPSIKAELYFVISSAELFMKFTQRFQCEEPLIHKLYEEIRNVLQVFLGRVLKTTVTNKISNFSKIDFDELFAITNRLPLEELVLNSEVLDELSKLKESDKLSFLREAQNHYITACRYVMEKTCLPNDSLKSFRFLDPKERTKSRSCKDLVRVAKIMPFDIPLDHLLDEWKVLQLEKDDTEFQNKPIDAYWQQHISKKDLSSNDLKFPTVAKLIKAALALSHGNAEIERRFSISKHILGENKSAMTERFLNSVLTVKDALKEYPHFLLLPIDPQLIKYGQQAHSRYTAYMEEMKRKQKIELEEKEREEQRKRDSEEKLKNMEKIQKSIEYETTTFNEKKKDYLQTKEATEELLSEASAKLKKALEKNDLKGAKIAQAMLEGVKSMQAEERAKEKEVEKIQKNIEKRKSSVITSFFAKKPKI